MSGLRDSLGLYLHWPYCARICPYCDFNVYRPRDEGDALLAAILTDMTRWRQMTGARPLVSLHLGGGTPSLMTAHQLERVISHAEALWGFDSEIEIGLEANPKDMAGFADMARAGINRLSLGVQSLRDDVLKRLGRDHSSDMARQAIEQSNAIFARSSVDLIYAHAGQTEADWDSELREILAFGTSHLSPYQLTIEPGTAFGKRVQRGESLASDTDFAADLFALTEAVCREHGLELYEISNFARSDSDQSRHNRLYWEGGDWIGVGPGAHGRLGRAASGGRQAIAPARRPAEYVRIMDSDGTWSDIETLSAQDELAERILMGLRLASGLDRRVLRAATGRDIDADMAARFQTQGLVELEDDRVRLSSQGRVFADRISGELVPESDQADGSS